MKKFVPSDPTQEYDFEECPAREYILLVLEQAVEDRATHLNIDECRVPDEGVRIGYRVDGKWYQMSPFPVEIRRPLVSRLCEMAGIPQPEFPFEGVIDGECDGLRLRWRVAIAGPDAAIKMGNLTESIGPATGSEPSRRC